MAENYVENSTFTIPQLQNGVQDLGDLWDCRKTVAVQHNLLVVPVSSEEYIQATPLRNCDYTFTHVKNELDKTRNLKIEGHVSIDLLLKEIELDGSIKYNAQKKENCENFIVDYTYEDHKIYLMPPLGKDVNRHLIEKLNSKEIEATHVVGAIIVGGEVHGVVEVKSKNDSRKWDLAGVAEVGGGNKNSTEDDKEDLKEGQSFIMTNSLTTILNKLSGSVTGELKATWLSAEENNKSNIRVNFKARPAAIDALPTPKGENNSGNGTTSSVKSMFEFIENMPLVIRKEMSFQRFGKDIFGVPIRFILYPLSHYIDFNLQRLYKQLDDSVMRRFQETLSQIIDIQQSGYVQKLILEEDEEMSFFLDSKSLLLDDVSQFEKQLQGTGAEFEVRCRKAMSEYKFGKQCQDEIYAIVKEFNQSEAGSVFKKVQEFVATGRLELLNGQVFQAKSKMVIFTDRGNLDKWYGKNTRPLILMETNSFIPPGAIKSLSELSEFLHNLGIEAGMATSSVSKEATLTLKFCERKPVFVADEMTYALETLKTMAGIGEPTTATFYRILASLKGIRLFVNKENSCELDRIVSELVAVRSSCSNLYCADSLADLRKQISAADDKSFVFCLPINAPDTDLEFLTNWEDSVKHLPNARWVAYNFDFPDLNEAPLLIIFKESRLQAICLDNLDVFNLKHQLLETRGRELTMLSPENLQNCLYPERARYALAILSRLEPLRHVETVENQELLKTGTNNVVEEFLVLLRSFLSGDPSHIALVMKARSSLKKQILNCTKILKEMENRSPNQEQINHFKVELNAVIDNPCCPDSFKEQLNEMQQSGEADDKIVIRAKNILPEMCSTLKSRKFSLMKAFKKSLKIISRGGSLTAKESVEETIRYLVKQLCTLREIVEERMLTQITNYAREFQPYLVLHSLSPYKHGKGLRLLYEGLRQLTSLNDCEVLQKIIQSVSNTLDEIQIEALWKNFQWQFLVKTCIESERNAVVFRALWEWLQKTKHKDAFPEHIKAKLNERFKISSKKLNTVKDVAEFFQDTIDLFEQIPRDFQETLTDSLVESEQLERELCESLKRTEWNSEQKLIKMEWEMDKVKVALRCLTESLQAKEALALATDFNLIFLKMPITQHDEPLAEDKGKEVCTRFRQIYSSHLPLITDEEYMTVKSIIRQPVINADSNMPILLSLAKYILQQIKMWNGNILKPYILSNISKTDENRTEECRLSCDPFVIDTESSLTSAPDQVTVHVHSVTRLDIFAYLINAADCFVAREILRVMSKFPMPLPLIVPDILKENKYIITVPLLENLIIRWETENAIENQAPGNGNTCRKNEHVKVSQIVENHLFSSPFRLVVAIRLGTHKPGKSHLLNHLMVGENFFSAYDEPGGKHGPPCTLDGTVEFAWLTKETCVGALWTSVMEAHYASQKNEIVLLANMHGEATKHLDILIFLKKIAFGFLVFLMPELDDITRGKWNVLKSQIGNKPITFVKVDPKEYVEKNLQMISTSGLTIEATKDKLRRLLKCTLTDTTEQKRASTEDVVTAELVESLRFANGVATEKAQQLAKEVRNITCVEIKKHMKTFLSRGYDGWKDNENLKKIVGLAVQLLNSSVGDELKKAFYYLETELSRISASESMRARYKIAETQIVLYNHENSVKENADTQTIDRDENNEHISKTKDKLLFHKTEAEDANLGLEHFFRVFSHIHHIALGHYSPERLANSGVLELPKYYATLLLEGHALEILNGDTGTISLNWLRAIFRHVDVLKPNLRVYVISIIGLQSSGKSTLLNALFSCRFAVSVGRCSRGLYMRMIFLEEDLRKEHGYDAIILIDTEGLASSEKMNDPDANRKDRLLATFAMGLSNLTIVNVLGEELTKITEILQIVIITMARLREADVKPDMLVVQHLQERNALKFDEANHQFIGAITRAFELVSKSDVELGATHNACLKDLMHRITRQDLFLQLKPFKEGSSVHSPPSESYHEDVVNLYQILLRKARDSTRKHSIQRWFQLIENYWNSVTQEKFALDFKSAQHVTEYLNYAQSVTKIKEALRQAFTRHVEIMSKEIEDEVDRHIGNKERKQTEDLRTDIIRKMEDQLRKIPYGCDQICCNSFKSEENKLCVEIKDTEWEYDLKDTLEKCIAKKRDRESAILKQLFDVSIIRRGCFSEFLSLITSELKNELKKRPSGKFTEEEKTKISDTIWDRSRDIVSKRETDSTLIKEIENSIVENYENVYPDIWQHIKKGVAELENKSAKTTGMFFSCALNEAQRQHLVKKVHNFIPTVLQSFNLQCFDLGLKFETAIIAAFKSQYPDMLKGYEAETKVELKDDHKYTVLVYALVQFINEMEKIQEIWNRQHIPSIILLEKESFYKEQIKTRLDHGFSSAADGYVQAGYIIDATKDKARKAGYRGKIQSVLDHVWTTNSEKMRLQYFEELALEVKDGVRERAMEHFIKPKESIEEWFKRKCESMYSGHEIQQIYEQTMNTEIDNILQTIRNVTKFEELQTFLQKYCISEEDESCIETRLEENDFASLRDSIIDKIQEFSQTGRREYVLQAPASKDKEVMKRLGCTASCPWCGALCWGSRGHDEDKGETRKHHTCHQPNGLNGTHVVKKGIKFLDPRCCHDIPESEKVVIPGMENTTAKWDEAKTEYFKDWKFDKHVTMTFYDMMHWFFQELHEDISARPNKSPVPPEWLEERTQFNLEDILPAVRSIKD